MMLKPHAALHSHFRRTSVLFKSFINRVLLLLIANKVANTLEIEGRRQIEENTGTSTYSTNMEDVN